MIQLSYNGELYSYDNKTSTTVSSTSSILVVLHPYVDIEGAKLFYSQEDTEGIVDITNNEAEIPGAYLVTGDLQVALKLASSEMSNTFTINVTKINSSGEVTDDDIQFTMDNKKRLILVPGSQGILAVQYDNRSEIVTFKFPRYQEEVDLSTKIPYVNYKRPQAEDLGRSLCTVEKTDDLFIYFSWMVDITATQYDGTIQFQVEFTDGENYRWQSQIGELPVLTSLYNTGLEPYEPDVLEQYLQRINTLIQRGVGVPAGGEPDQVLAKKSGTDFDVEWRSSGVPSTELSEAGYVLTLFSLPSGKLVPTWLSNEYPVFFSFRLDNDGNVIQGPTWEEVLGVTFNKIVIAHVSTPNGAEVHRLLCTRRQDYNYYHPVTIRFSGMEVDTIYSLVNGQTQDTWFFEENSVEGIASLQLEEFSDGVIGDLSDLETSDQSNLVAAINEIHSGQGGTTISDIFAATYGTTTESEITSAVSAGKVVIVKISDEVFYLTGKAAIGPSGSAWVFASVNQTSIRVTFVSGSYWNTVSTRTIPTSASDIGAVAADQGTANAGKFLVVGSDGVVAPVTMTAWQGGSY